MKHVMLFIVLCLLSLGAQGQTESGIIVEGGTGNIKTKLTPSAAAAAGSYDVDYKYNLSLGYKFRLHANQASPFFFDLEAGLGMKYYDYTFGKMPGEPALVKGSAKRFSAFATGTANYTLYKGLSIGAGIQPTWFFNQNGGNSRKFDIPAIGRIAYRFKAFEVGLNYKHGLMNSLKTDHLKSGKFREYTLSVWVPF
ncbi:hypothetical protein [Bacteroides muris (ex Fokt et al. 2023)]|uniref:Outer membrane protein beta-barrel domain-containing protein n=1 Tax=Bacteroides muris (ex Fokt et al. 2023) TaxID=2937417 RepID=A0A9X2NRJ9_9BACE|nr:hypothetical protein [Bacteroides muris (ex Fokt et al. 2023)]MCR6504863.1 hypothetical protein [Bacteroides muris (ex Fokt et al. 2023)]